VDGSPKEAWLSDTAIGRNVFGSVAFALFTRVRTLAKLPCARDNCIGVGPLLCRRASELPVLKTNGSGAKSGGLTGQVVGVANDGPEPAGKDYLRERFQAWRPRQRQHGGRSSSGVDACAKVSNHILFGYGALAQTWGVLFLQMY
jgi:hypothetical protein